MPALVAALLLAPGPSVASQPAGKDVPAPSLTAEETFWQQPERIAEAARTIAPARPDHMDVFFVGFAGDDSQDIFVREVRYASEVIADRVDPPGRSLLLLNGRSANAAGSPIASIGTLRLALETVASRMDPSEDILFLYLSSHGLPTHDLYVANGELPLEQIAPARLRELIDRFGFRRKVIVISACFSGEFATALADDSSVVLTAARADRPSFGCRDSRGLTYFGEALWRHAMQRADTLFEAFSMARLRVGTMEAEAGLLPSEPQLFVGRLAEPWLGEMFLRPAPSTVGSDVPSLAAEVHRGR